MEQIFGLIISTIFGAIFGSYATLFAYRLPLGESCFGRYFGQKSHCPQCNVIIKTRDLIPLLNWLFTLGRCRSCQTKIPRTHLFIEFATTILFAICYLKFSFSEEFIIHAMICSGIVILLACDFTHKAFPNSILNFILIFCVANRVLVDQSIIEMIISSAIAVIFAIVFYQIFYKRAAGLFASQTQSFDYVKFILIAGVYFGVSSFIFYFSVVMMILVALLLLKIPSKKNHIGFGYAVIIPFLWLMFCPIV